MTPQRPFDDKRYRRAIYRRMSLHRWKDRWPMFLWLLACGLAAFLYFSNPTPDSSYTVQGVVDADASSVSPVETARIRKVHVQSGQTVRAGEVLVEMDTALIDHGVTADVIDMISIRTSFGDTHQDVLQAVSQRRDALAAIEVDIALCRQEWARESAELKALRVEQERREALRQQGIIDDLVRGELLPAIANLEEAMAEYPPRLAAMERQRAEAVLFERGISDWLGAQDDESISQAIARRLDEAAVMEVVKTAEEQAVLHRESYVLRAPQDGVVSAIFFREGDVVTAGLPVLRVANAAPTRVIGFLNDAQLGGFPVGSSVQVVSAGRSTHVPARAVLTALSAETHSTAYMISATGQAMPLRAQRAFFELTTDHEFVGGEMVYLRPERKFSLAGLVGHLTPRSGGS